MTARLAFVIARTWVSLKLSIHVARIGTRLDQVAGVLYITNLQEEKILPGEDCECMQHALQAAVDQFLAK